MHDFFHAGPPALRLNAWTGHETAPTPLEPGPLVEWLRRQPTAQRACQADRVPGRVETWDWRSPQVGWGLVLPDDDSLQPARRATADDAPPAIQRLVAARGAAPVLRWRASDSGIGQLVRYGSDGRVWDLALVSETGIAPWQLPQFLLICAPPDRIPWTFQYAANLGRCVGRLWLQGQALDHYVDALISDWAGSACNPQTPLVWSVDHGQPDITWLMDRAISRKLAEAWRNDPDQDFAGATALWGADATQEQLIAALVRTQPSLVVTTSHGMTGPLADAQQMAAQLGVPVDVSRKVLDLTALCEQWQPDGAIWYAHACCSAGSDTVSAYDGLFDRGSEVGSILAGVAAGCGASIAPLPQRLLGAKRPLRAFIGHVEPTFDWTLRDPHTGQPLTHSLRSALYGKLFEDGQRRPIGWAMAQVFGEVGTLLFEWKRAAAAIDAERPRSLAKALYYQIAALDRQHTVILGDPTAALPQIKPGLP